MHKLISYWIESTIRRKRTSIPSLNSWIAMQFHRLLEWNATVHQLLCINGLFMNSRVCVRHWIMFRLLWLPDYFSAKSIRYLFYVGVLTAIRISGKRIWCLGVKRSREMYLAWQDMCGFLNSNELFIWIVFYFGCRFTF